MIIYEELFSEAQLGPIKHPRWPFLTKIVNSLKNQYLFSQTVPPLVFAFKLEIAKFFYVLLEKLKTPQTHHVQSTLKQHQREIHVFL